MKSDFPKDNPFGIWLSPYEFEDDEYTRDVALARDLPADGPFYLFPPQWLRGGGDDEILVVKARAVRKATPKPAKPAKPAWPAEPGTAGRSGCGEYGTSAASCVIEAGGNRFYPKHKFREIDDDCFFDCESYEELPGLGVDMAPHLLDLGPSESTTAFSPRARCSIEKVLTRSCSRSYGKVVFSACEHRSSESKKSLFVIGAAARIRHQGENGVAALNSAWASFSVKPDVWRPRPNLLITSRLTIDPTASLFVRSEAESVRAWADVVLSDSANSLDRCQKKIVALEQELSAEKRTAGALSLVAAVTVRALSSRFLDLIKKISADPRVESVVLRGKIILLRTKDVYVQYGSTDSSAFLGKYEFRVGLDSGIRFRNCKLPERSYWMHPHAFDGGVCLGSYQTTINNCFLSFDYLTLMLTLLEWTGDINPQDSQAVRSLGTDFKAKPPAEDRASEWYDFIQGSLRQVGEDRQDDDDEEENDEEENDEI